LKTVDANAFEGTNTSHLTSGSRGVAWSAGARVVGNTVSCASRHKTEASTTVALKVEGVGSSGRASRCGRITRVVATRVGDFASAVGGVFQVACLATTNKRRSRIGTIF